ncbi:MAG: flagellar biosynthesis protein FlhB [Gammaproteobacteria bacterium]|nr:flagellar biosynthesis protein FlhB [Gammaproteobacteria bacterium]
MAQESESGQERTEEASAQRRTQARERGEVPRSRELGTTLLLMAATAVLWISSARFIGAIQGAMRADFRVERGLRMSDVEMLHAMHEALMAVLTSLAPFLLVSAVVSVAGGIALGGWNFSAEGLAFKWQRLDPLAGVGRMFSVKSLVELAKAFTKFALLLSIGLASMWHDAPAISQLASLPIGPAFAATGALAFKAFLIVSSGTLLIALVDVPFQLWDYARNQRMTRQEVREESRESEGSPEVKARIRGLQQELARRRMMEQVPKADVVVTNPEHYAVALRFDPATMSAPQLVAKGMDHTALRIREIARESGITMLEAPPLARAVYHTTKINHEIPAGLYLAVAQVLAYVFQLRRRQPGGPQPLPPRELPIPPELAH